MVKQGRMEDSKGNRRTMSRKWWRKGRWQRGKEKRDMKAVGREDRRGKRAEGKERGTVSCSLEKVEVTEKGRKNLGGRTGQEDRTKERRGRNNGLPYEVTRGGRRRRGTEERGLR